MLVGNRLADQTSFLFRLPPCRGFPPESHRPRTEFTLKCEHLSAEGR
jgi:hypothetical protein